MKNLYIHIPFCISKCEYCDFVSFGGQSTFDMESYTKAVISDIASLPQSKFETVFLGGGTPTALPMELLRDIMQAIEHRHFLKRDCEISIEANPETLGKDYCLALRDMGFNRISIGLQSSDDSVLKTIGRVHTFDRFKMAYEAARSSGFNNVNVDIMYGLPRQTSDVFKDTIKEVMELAPTHISAYELNLSGNSPMDGRIGKGELTLPDEEEVIGMTDCLTMLETVYWRYEISNYAMSGYECKHNLNYWNGGSYFGIGCGAHGCLDKETARFYGFDVYSLRYENTASVAEYIKGAKPKYVSISKREAMFETVMTGLRLTCGICEQRFIDRYKTELYPIIKDYVLANPNLIIRDNGYIYLSKRGMDIQNTVLTDIMDRF